MAIYQFGDKVPAIDPTAWIAETATIIGDVTVGPNASIWPGAVLRGDDEPIRIGAGSNIQDNCVVHTDEGAPVNVGCNVTVGHSAILHGCTIEDGCLIGMGATILNWARVCTCSMVGAGSLVSQNKTVEARSLVIGRPARKLREMTDEEIAAMQKGAPYYQERARLMAAGLRRIG